VTPEPSVRDWPHRYTGRPSTIHHARRPLVVGEACRIIGRRAGGLRIKTTDGNEWIVGPRDVERRLTQAETAARTLAIYCQNCGALPGEKCHTHTGKPCQRRKLMARNP
jgi:hypothetical protein